MWNCRLNFSLEFRFLFHYFPREFSSDGREDVFDHDPESFSAPWPVEDVDKGVDHVDQPVPRVSDHTYQLFVGNSLQGNQIKYVDWEDEDEIAQGQDDGRLHDCFGSSFVVLVWIFPQYSRVGYDDDNEGYPHPDGVNNCP